MVDISKIRNIGVVAHIDAGKTTTVERILYFSGSIHKMGEVHDGTAVMDWMVQEQERGITITSASTTCFWRDCHINIIDTPGHVDFTVEVERSLRVLDGAVVVFCAVAGVQPQSELVWFQADRYRVPRVIFVNKMDRLGADFFSVLRMIGDRLGVSALPFQLPYYSSGEFVGFCDLVNLRFVRYLSSGFGDQFVLDELPSDALSDVFFWRDKLLEGLAEFDDVLLDLYLSGGVISPEKLLAVAKGAVVQLKLFPVFCGSAFKNKGIQFLLDAVIDCLPSPQEVSKSPPALSSFGDFSGSSLSALVFKIAIDPFVGPLCYLRVYSGQIEVGQSVFNSTRGKCERVGRILRMFANKREDVHSVFAGDIVAVSGFKFAVTGDTICDESFPVLLERISFPAPVVSVVVESKSKVDQERLRSVLDTLCLEDPSLLVSVDVETGQVILAGMGELHLDVVVDRLRRDFKLDVRVGSPRVSYKETVVSGADASFSYSKNIAGVLQCAQVLLSVAPVDRSLGVIFKNFSSLPSGHPFLAAIKSGIDELLSCGFLAGFSVTDLCVSLLEVSGVGGDPTEIACKIAASMACRLALERAGVCLLEPLMDVEIVVPEDCFGQVVADLHARRGRVLNSFLKGLSDVRVVEAKVPLVSMFGYSTELRSRTRGRGIFVMTFASYEIVSRDVLDVIVSDSKGNAG